MEKKIEYVDIKELKPEGKFIKGIGFKSKISSFSYNNRDSFMCYFKYLCNYFRLIFYCLKCFCLIKVKDHKTIDIYEKGVVVYKSDDDNKAIYIPFNELQEWGGKYSEYGSSEAIMFKLQNGETIYKNTFLANNAYIHLNRVASEKESKAIAAEKRKNHPLTHPLIEKFKNKLMRKD